MGFGALRRAATGPAACCLCSALVGAGWGGAAPAPAEREEDSRRAARFFAWPAAAVAECERAAARVVGDFAAGAGLVFRDGVEVSAHDDPKVDGVVLHMSSMRRPITERLGKDFFSDPSQVSITATRVGPISLKEPIETGTAGEVVFNSRRSLIWKSVNVRRVYDPVANCLVYVSYSERISQDMSEANSRFRTSVSAVPLVAGVDSVVAEPPNK